LRKKKKKKKTEETHPTLTRMIAKPKECQQKQKTKSKKAKKQKAKKPKSQSKKPKSQKWIQLVLPNPIASFSSKATKLKTRTK
jgi:hypothetical protein